MKTRRAKWSVGGSRFYSDTKKLTNQNNMEAELKKQADLILDAAEGMIPRVAKIMRLYYKKLIKEGFLPEEALRIVEKYQPK